MTQHPDQQPNIIQVQNIARDLEAPLKRYFARNGFSKSDVDDLVQEVFLKLSKLEALSGIENTQAYMFQIAANVMRDRLRLARTRPQISQHPLESQNEPPDVHDPERLLIARESLSLIQHALMLLPQRTRTVFLLHRFDGLKYKEIAKVLGISISSVEKHMMLALSRVLAASKKL